MIASAAALVLGIAALVVGLQAHAAPATPTLFGTLDTQPATVAAEAGSSDVSMAMLEDNWASFEPSPGVFSSSYLATMKSELAAYKAAGMKVTLGLGLQNPPAWVLALADGTYVDQTGAHSTEANFVFSAAVRHSAAAAAISSRSRPTSRCRTSTRSGWPPAATARCSTPAAAPTGPSTAPP